MLVLKHLLKQFTLTQAIFVMLEVRVFIVVNYII